MDKIWYRNPSKLEVIGRCGGDEKSEWSRRTDKKSNAKKIGKKWKKYGQTIRLTYIKLSYVLIFKHVTMTTHINLRSRSGLNYMYTNKTCTLMLFVSYMKMHHTAACVCLSETESTAMCAMYTILIALVTQN